jgi:putative Mg2+ transporter-C (MgtC) family protein
LISVDVWDWLLRLALAAGVGAMIGGERESRGHPAGVRTQALVALASALLTGVGKAGFIAVGVDLSRIASQVVTGIGFIGAGVILQHRGTVTGLTTAATLFLSAGLGVAIGAGLVVPALLTAGIALIVIYGLRMLKPVLLRGVPRTVQIDYLQGHGTFGPLIRTVQEAGGSIEDLQVVDDTAEHGQPMRHVSMKVVTRKDTNLYDELQALLSRPEVTAISVTDG